MKIAAIDIGSNSLHMVIVETGRGGGFQVIAREKEMVRLGAGALASRRLPAAAVRRGLETLRRYREIARAAGADKLLAVATSAVREAKNGEDFLDAAGDVLGVRARAIAGLEEARLIYKAALHSVHLEGKRSLVVDIGGGSVELALGAGDTLELAASEKLGVLRMSEAFVRSDPLSGRDEARLARHVEQSIARHVAAIRAKGFDRVVGTSGTILALGALALQRRGGLPDELHHAVVSAEDLRAVRKWLVASDARARLRAAALDESRVDIIVAGAVVLDAILEGVGAREVVLCEWALREGVLLDYIHGHPKAVARAEAYPDVRMRSVVGLAERCQWDERHARQVARLALQLYDGTRRRHGLGDGERSLLEAAALLHDIGHHISYERHHKHTYYLVKQGGLHGFTPGEVDVIANVARYHRRGHPRRKHEEFAALPRRARRVVEVLAGCLRVADALDRSHRQVVEGLEVRTRPGAVRVRARAEGDASLETWGIARRVGLLEEALDAKVRVDVASAARPRRARAGRLAPVAG
jgi:exopolyphosphatase/guanosine-5'-triphosphate,3'-diphosphate pyrophosphatase